MILEYFTGVSIKFNKYSSPLILKNIEAVCAFTVIPLRCNFIKFDIMNKTR